MSAAALPDEPLRETVHHDAGWGSFGGAVQGGLVAGRLVEAAERAVGRAASAATVHLHRRVEPGPAEIVATVERVGRTLASARTRLEQGDVRAGATVLLAGGGVGVGAGIGAGGGSGGAGIGAGIGPAAAHPAGEVATPWDGLFAGEPRAGERLVLPGGSVPFSRHLEYRPVGVTRPLGGGRDPFLAAWLRFEDAATHGRPWGATAAAILLDALAPSLFAIRTRPIAAPTVEFTLHLTGRRPVGEWFQLRQRMVWSSGALCQDDAELRDERGYLLATSRQLRAIPAGRA